MSEGPAIEPADLELSSSKQRPPNTKLKHLKAELEKDLIQQALVSQNWNITRAAQKLDITRQTLHGMMKKYRLEKPR